ncbi:MAG: hypothetical protein V7746_08940 [Halioglobus sp.]
MQYFIRMLSVSTLASAVLLLSGCDDPQVYGSVGVSSGYSNYGGYRGGYRGGYGSGVRTSVSVGGRIR